MIKQTVKGMFLKNLADYIKKTKGVETYKLVEEKFGDLKFSSIKNYDTEDQIRLHNAVIEVLYGENTSEANKEIGKIAFQTYADSFIGKTMFALFGGDIKKAALGVQTAINTVATGFELKVQELNNTKIAIKMTNLPYPIEYYQGIWEAALEHFQKKGFVIVNRLDLHDYEYIVEWE